MFLELAKPASLFASMFSLLAVFHAAFFGSQTDLDHRLWNATTMLILAAAVSLASGLLFTQQDQPKEVEPSRLARTQALHQSNVLPFRRRPLKPASPLAQPHPAQQSIGGVFATLPMRFFCWGAGLISLLFLLAWFIETYCIPLSRARF
jgi:hypothetical protein